MTTAIKVGDIVHVRARIICGLDEDGQYEVQSASEGVGTGYVPAADIVHVEPRPLQVGDKVKHKRVEYVAVGEVRAVEGDSVWVRWPGDAMSTWPIDALKHIP